MYLVSYKVDLTTITAMFFFSLFGVRDFTYYVHIKKVGFDTVLVDVRMKLIKRRLYFDIMMLFIIMVIIKKNSITCI